MSYSVISAPSPKGGARPAVSNSRFAKEAIGRAIERRLRLDPKGFATVAFLEAVAQHAEAHPDAGEFELLAVGVAAENPGVNL